MNDKNELNDIILDRHGSSSATKKLLLAIAALSLILIVVLVVMNSINSTESEEKTSISKKEQPSAPVDEADEPLFEPVEVIEEIAGEPTLISDDLEQIAQKIREESLENKQVNAPAVSDKPVEQKIVQPEKIVKKEPEKKIVAPTIKKEPEVVVPKIVTPKIAEQPKAATPAKTPEQPKQAEKPAVSNDTTVYYVQVGVFTQEPDKKLFERISANGFKYITTPATNATKVMVGPFEGRQRANEALGVIKRNVEANAFITKG